MSLLRYLQVKKTKENSFDDWVQTQHLTNKQFKRKKVVELTNRKTGWKLSVLGVHQSIIEDKSCWWRGSEKTTWNLLPLMESEPYLKGNLKKIFFGWLLQIWGLGWVWGIRKENYREKKCGSWGVEVVGADTSK